MFYLKCFSISLAFFVACVAMTALFWSMPRYVDTGKEQYLPEPVALYEMQYACVQAGGVWQKDGQCSTTYPQPYLSFRSTVEDPMHEVYQFGGAVFSLGVIASVVGMLYALGSLVGAGITAWRSRHTPTAADPSSIVTD